MIAIQFPSWTALCIINILFALIAVLVYLVTKQVPKGDLHKGVLYGVISGVVGAVMFCVNSVLCIMAGAQGYIFLFLISGFFALLGSNVAWVLASNVIFQVTEDEQYNPKKRSYIVGLISGDGKKAQQPRANVPMPSAAPIPQPAPQYNPPVPSTSPHPTPVPQQPNPQHSYPVGEFPTEVINKDSAGQANFDQMQKAFEFGKQRSDSIHNPQTVYEPRTHGSNPYSARTPHPHPPKNNPEEKPNYVTYHRWNPEAEQH